MTNYERTKKLKKRLHCLTNHENPKSIRSMAKLLKSIKITIHRVINRDLGKVKRKKTKVHALKESHIQNRQTNARKLYEGHLAGGRDEYVLTIDEALFRVDDFNGTRSICYVRHGENVPIQWVCQ